MALTEGDKYRVIFALCHNGKVLIPTSTHYSSIIESRLLNLNTYIETQALALTTKIEAAKLLMESSPTKDNVKQIGDIVLDTERSRGLKQKELKRLLGELSQLLDIPNRCKVGGGGVGCLVL